MVKCILISVDKFVENMHDQIMLLRGKQLITSIILLFLRFHVILFARIVFEVTAQTSVQNSI